MKTREGREDIALAWADEKTIAAERTMWCAPAMQSRAWCVIILGERLAMKVWYHRYKMMKGCLKRECSERATASDIVENAMYRECFEQEGSAVRRVEIVRRIIWHMDDAFGWNSYTQKWKSLLMHTRMEWLYFRDRLNIHYDRDRSIDAMMWRCDALCLVRGQKKRWS